jgi:hypothetical protein
MCEVNDFEFNCPRCKVAVDPDRFFCVECDVLISTRTNDLISRAEAEPNIEAKRGWLFLARISAEPFLDDDYFKKEYTREKLSKFSRN